MKWIKINFCENNKCTNSIHSIIEHKKVCDQESLPSRFGNYLISDGKRVDSAEFGLTFMNYNNNHRLHNKDILYWAELTNIQLPKGKSHEEVCIYEIANS